MTNKHYTLGSYQYLNLTDSQSPGGNPIPLELYTSIHAPTFGSHKDQSPSLTRLAHSPRPLYGVGHPPPNAPFSHRSTGNEVQHFNEIDVGRILRPVLKQFLLTFQTALLHNFPELIERHMTQKLGSYPNRTAFGSPKDAIHHLSDIESFLYRHWSTVFSYAFPNGDNISLVLKDRGYSRTWQEWWNWSAGLESALIPRKLAIEDWVAAWAYIWRHLLPPGDDYTVYNQTQETWSDMLCPIFEVLGGHY